MDQGPLVEKQIDDGRRLAEQLAHDGFDVTAAAWVRESAEGQTYLYIASRAVDDKGVLAVYRDLHAAFQRLPGLWVDPFEVKLVGVSHPMTAALLAHQPRSPNGRLTHYRGGRLGNRSVEEAYIYPAVASVSSSA